jgi:hypothetical protein
MRFRYLELDFFARQVALWWCSLSRWTSRIAGSSPSEAKASRNRIASRQKVGEVTHRAYAHTAPQADVRPVIKTSEPSL